MVQKGIQNIDRPWERIQQSPGLRSKTLLECLY